MLEKVSKRENVSTLVLIIYGGILSYLSYTENKIIGDVALAGIIFSWVVDKRMPIAMFITATMLDCEFTSLGRFLAILNVSISCLIFLLTLKVKGLRTYRNPVVLFFIVFVISFFLGKKCEISIAILFLFSLLLCYTIALLHESGKGDIILSSLLIGGLCMMAVMMAIIAQGGVYGVVRRLTFHDNIKLISTAIAFPIFHLTWVVISNYSSIKPLRRFVYIILALACVFVLILTYSRGVMLALAITTAFMLFFQMRKFSVTQFFFFLLLLVSGYYLINKMSIDANLIFDRTEGGNGRTEIWFDFYNKMKLDGIARLLFGFGPGDLKRIVTDVYAHSVILDYFFSYGIAGFLCFGGLLYVTIKELIKCKYMYGLCLLLLCCIMYFPHGASYTMQFYYLLGLCIVSNRNYKLKRV